MNISNRLRRWLPLTGLMVLGATVSQADINLVIKPNSSSQAPQSEFTTVLEVQPFGGSVVGAFDATIVYDATMLEILDITAPEGSPWSGNMELDRSSFRSGSTRVVGFTTTNVTAGSQPENWLNIRWKTSSQLDAVSQITVTFRALIDATWKPLGYFPWASFTIIQAPGPQIQKLNAGTSTTLGVVPSADAGFNFQWQKDGVDISGATSTTLTLSNLRSQDAGTYAIFISSAWGSMKSTIAALAEAPAIVNSPTGKAVRRGGTLTLTVATSGSGALAYVWKKDGVVLVEGDRFSGTNTASLAIANAQFSDAGSYEVIVTGLVDPVVTSTPAALAVVEARQARVNFGYTAGQAITIENSLTYAGTPIGLGWQTILPEGWSYVSGAGKEGEVKPALGTTNLLEWSWASIPTSPFKFTVTLGVPTGTTGDKEFRAKAVFGLETGSNDILVMPDPLVVSLAPDTHSTDSDRDWKISLIELTRSIELYNTRNGGSRTGAYKFDPAGEDSFTQDGTRVKGTPTTLTCYHSADSNKDATIDLFELTRIIELYNYRSGSQRTGQYHVQRSPPTEDGFAPGP